MGLTQIKELFAFVVGTFLAVWIALSLVGCGPEEIIIDIVVDVCPADGGCPDGGSTEEAQTEE